MQPKFHPAVLSSQNSLLPEGKQDGNRMHGDLPWAISSLGPAVVYTSAQTSLIRGWEDMWYLVSNIIYAMHALSILISYLKKKSFRTLMADHSYLLSYLLEYAYNKALFEKKVIIVCVCVYKHTKSCSLCGPVFTWWLLVIHHGHISLPYQSSLHIKTQIQPCLLLKTSSLWSEHNLLEDLEGLVPTQLAWQSIMDCPVLACL